MNFQVLISTMDQVDKSLIEKMNLQSDALVINQTNKVSYEELEFRGNKIEYYSFNERGIGLSRNSALMRADADICLFADDDVSYADGYKSIILEAFTKNPEADIILFNVPSKNPNRPTHFIKKEGRVRWYNCHRYGAVKIAIRLDKVINNNIYFSLLFGGGAKYSNGEDSLFLVECLKKNLRIYAVPTIIGYVEQTDSTWFKGYTDKYFIDRGVLFSKISPKWSNFLCLQFCIRHRRMFKMDKSWWQAYKLMLKGTKILN